METGEEKSCKFCIVVPTFTTTSPARIEWLFLTKYSTQTACSYNRFLAHVPCSVSSFRPNKQATPNCAVQKGERYPCN